VETHACEQPLEGPARRHMVSHENKRVPCSWLSSGT